MMITRELAAAVLKAFATQVGTQSYVTDGAAMIDAYGRIFSRAEAADLLNCHLEFLDAVGDELVDQLNESLADKPPGNIYSLTSSQMEPALTEGYAYLMHNPTNNLYKIGRSNNPQSRVYGVASEEQCAEIYLVHQIKTDDCIWLESRLHGVFAHLRKRGEWFTLRPADVAWFKSHQEWPRVAEDSRTYTNDFYAAAVSIARQNKHISGSTLQRTLRVGYTKAARLIEEMEHQGVIGPRVEGQLWHEVIGDDEQPQTYSDDE